MSNFPELAKNIQKDSILSEIDKQQTRLLGFFGNFTAYLPRGYNYERTAKEGESEKQFKTTGRNNAEFKRDIDDCIKESGIDFEAAMKLWEESHQKFRECKRLLQLRESDQTAINELERQIEELQSRFLEAIKPLYVTLRMKGYQHSDLSV